MASVNFNYMRFKQLHKGKFLMQSRFLGCEIASIKIILNHKFYAEGWEAPEHVKIFLSKHIMFLLGNFDAKKIKRKVRRINEYEDLRIKLIERLACFFSKEQNCYNNFALYVFFICISGNNKFHLEGFLDYYLFVYVGELSQIFMNSGFSDIEFHKRLNIVYKNIRFNIKRVN